MSPRATPAPRSSLPAFPEPDEPTGISIPDDIRADLLREQGESIETPPPLPRIKVMPAGAGLFEFTDTHDCVREFTGVILNNHPRNVLWDKKFGTVPESASDEEKRPPCQSPDGRWGLPKEGFAHPGLPNGQVGNGVLMVECKRCPLNQFGTGNRYITDANPKGKACTNQRSVYVLVGEREMPMELVLPPTSLTALDEYLTKLLNQGVPVQAVVTKFSQFVRERGAMKYGLVQLSVASALTAGEFETVIGKRTRYAAQINPPTATVALAAPVLEESETGIGSDEIPF